MPTYTFECPECGAAFDKERPVVQAAEPAKCPVCQMLSPRTITAPKLLFKADPRDNRPYWHNHDGYSHSHAPRRGRHPSTEDDH